VTLTEDIELMIRNKIRENVSPRHVPERIISVSDIPRTISGKIVEMSVANIVNNRPVKNIEALANPEVLEEFKNLEALKH